MKHFLMRMIDVGENILLIQFHYLITIGFTCRFSRPMLVAGENNPGWALTDIQSFSALIQRFLLFQRCSELNQPTLILTSLVIIDSVMNITGKQQTGKDHEKSQNKCFFFNIDAEETRNRKFQNNFKWVILKNSKNVIFRDLYFF